MKNKECNSTVEPKDLLAKYTNLWDLATEEQQELALDFAKDYCSFLDLAKTEREFVMATVEAVEDLGFKPIEDFTSLVSGDKVYQNIYGKGLMLAVIGTKPIMSGFNILGAHLDSPRADLKPCPLYEENEMSYFKTHYYGGIKKYQWTALPLALHGVVVRQDGSKIYINVGEDEEDPVFCFTDILPHLGYEQMKRPAPEIIRGEEMNVLIGGKPYPDKEVEQRFKLGIMTLLNKKYGIIEKDFVSAEIEVVPAIKARMVGFDSSFIGAYGQDDRVCAFTSLQAICSLDSVEKTAICMLTDKEEIGSDGLTGAKSRLYENFLAKIFKLTAGSYNDLDFRLTLENSMMLSSDVTNGYDPTFASVSDPKNSSYMGKGITLAKYTGSGGKGGASDASAEFLGYVAHLLNNSQIPWQTGELGKVDAGGGGTICKFAAEQGIQALDCGVPVLSMHSPFEITHTLDVYFAYLAYREFLLKA